MIAGLEPSLAPSCQPWVLLNFSWCFTSKRSVSFLIIMIHEDKINCFWMSCFNWSLDEVCRQKYFNWDTLMIFNSPSLKVALMHNNKPSDKVYQGTRSNYLFTVLLLISFLMCLIAVGWGITRCAILKSMRFSFLCNLKPSIQIF